ncbi:MAG: hypothetical protein B6D44_06400 [Ignavibacteriales bacterium UTCHB2]|jgi:predicted ATPase|nr:MAG: hypothetical protein BWY38_00936 [Ignavibacteria bacterium ADurb.Bin266]OQY73769.1 MAG: hypothetical protein B6D44_06400 [Ignavibacteriales bacterium UTCHB2]HQI40985.1 DUF3696 domain-containing protein [Ignavibacteriaceae bacterium]
MVNRNAKILFRVKNFKSLENAEIQLAPLTFLFGPNGSGKSSIFKALKFLHANLFPFSSDELNFKIDNTTDLNSFEDIVINGNVSKKITMEIEVEPGIFNKIKSEDISAYESLYKNSINNFNSEFIQKSKLPYNRRYPFNELFNYKLNDEEPKFEFNSIYRDDVDDSVEENFIFESVSGGRGLPTDFDNLIFPFKFRIQFGLQEDKYVIELIKIESSIEKFFIEFYPSLRKDGQIKRTISVFSNNKIDKIFQDFYDNFWGLPFMYDIYFEYQSVLNKFFYYKVQRTNLWEESSYNQRKNIYNKFQFWYHLTFQYIPSFIDNLLSIDHLQPVREEPKDIYVLKEGHFDHNEYYGLPSFLESKQKSYFIRKKMNEFGLAKGIRIKKEKSVGFLQYMPNERNYYSSIKGASSGLLQVLPVIFRSYINNQIFIEQPELHLHPNLQSKLAEYFVEVIKNKEIEFASDSVIQTSEIKDIPFFLIETHSEHLIRKVQICIAKGLIDRQNISVLYFDKNQKSGKTKLKKMIIDETGFFQEPWPDGFFDTSYNLTKELLRANKN